MKTLLLFIFLFGVVAEITVYGLIKKTCPVEEYTLCEGGYKTECCKNDDCNNGQVCCTTICETKCMDPMKNGAMFPHNMDKEMCDEYRKPIDLKKPIGDKEDERKLVCPAYHDIGCPKGYEIECCKNKDCEQGQVCCLADGCKLKCMEPMKKGKHPNLKFNNQQCYVIKKSPK